MTTSSLLQMSRIRSWEWLFWLAVLATPWVLPQHALIINEVAIVALFAVSLDLILGFAGVVSLGQAAYLGLGAYAAALFAKHVHPEPLYGLFVGIGSAAALGALCAPTILRGTDLTRIMVTIGVALILAELANQFGDITGGADGLQGVVMGPILGQFEFDLYGQTAACYSLCVLTLVFFIARRWMNSPYGATLKAVRDNRLRAESIGISVTSRIWVVYSISAAAAGAAGALLAQTSSFVSLDIFAMERSADVLLMLVIGGIGWLYGGVLGAVVFKLLHDVIASITPQYWTFWMGLILVVLVMAGRDRLLRPWTLWQRNRKTP
ncbi:MAG: branched-chain amino acid ABC transporter permease [Comamonas sp.]